MQPTCLGEHSIMLPHLHLKVEIKAELNKNNKSYLLILLINNGET